MLDKKNSNSQEKVIETLCVGHKVGNKIITLQDIEGTIRNEGKDPINYRRYNLEIFGSNSQFIKDEAGKSLNVVVVKKISIPHEAGEFIGKLLLGKK